MSNVCIFNNKAKYYNETQLHVEFNCHRMIKFEK